MKSTEIIPEDILDEYSPTDQSIIKQLEDQGYKLLGRGVDQSAFLEPGTGHVLKIFGTQNSTKVPRKNKKPTFSPDHHMFFEWAKYCNRNKNNLFLPKFSGFESFYWNNRVYLQIRQEALKPVDRPMGLVLEAIAETIDIYDAKNLGDIEEHIGHEVGDTDSINYKKLKKQIGADGLQQLFSTMRRLYLISQKNGWTFDLHRYNFMRRADGTPVIVDPWVI
jgi:hypothetical protein